MSFFRRYWQAALFFLVSVLGYLPALFGHGFADPDAFYHAKVSALLWQHGPLQTFPWLDLSLVGKAYADLHFLFHVFVAPFTVVFGLMDGLRIASLFLVVFLGSVFTFCLHQLQVRWPWMWALILVLFPPLCIRFSLGKASALAVLWLVFGIFAVLRRSPWLVGVALLGFSLSHGAWMVLFGSVVFLCFAQAFFASQLLDIPFWKGLYKHLSLLGAGVIGALVGLVLHPNFPQNIRFTWIQLVTIGIGTPMDRVLMGKEWMSPGVTEVVAACALVFILVGIFVILLSHVGFHPSRERMVHILSLYSLSSVFFALVFLSIRSVEYFAPVFLFALALCFSELEVKDFWRRFRRLALFLCFLFLGVWSFQYGKAVMDMRNHAYADDSYVMALRAIWDAGAKDGERVFHPLFDRFPLLFAQDERLRYVTGLDPTFLLVTDPALSDRIDLGLRHPEKLTIQDIDWMLERSGSRFVFLAKVGPYLRWVELLQQEKLLYTAIFEDSSSLVFKRRK